MGPKSAVAVLSPSILWAAPSRSGPSFAAIALTRGCKSHADRSSLSPPSFTQRPWHIVGAFPGPDINVP